MNHQKIKELLPLYIDDGLTKKEKKIIDKHLKDCKECQLELKKYQNNYKLLSSLKEIKAPENFLNSIKNKGGIIMKDRKDKEQQKTGLLEVLTKVFSKPIKIPTGIAGIAIVLLFVFLMSGSNVFFNNQRLDQLEEDTAYYYEEQSLEMAEEMNLNTRKAVPQANVLLDSNPDITAESQRKIIHRGNLSIEVRNFNKINDTVLDVTEKYNGYISDTRDWVNHNEQKFSRYQLRIPADNFNQALSELSDDNLGTVLARSISGQDVTEEYMDIEIRLRNLEIQQERYRQLYEKAEQVEEMLKIENELNRTRTEIERLQGRINYLDNQIGYSTITVEYQEQPPISSGTPGIVKAIRNALQEAVNQVYRIVILIGTLLPYLIIVLIAFLIYKKKSAN